MEKHVIQHFTQGACSAFAAALARRTGFPAFIIYQYNADLKLDGDYPWEIYHAFVRNHQGKAIDIQGVHKEKYARIHGESLRGMRTESATIDDLRNWHDSADEDYAEEILDTIDLDRFCGIV